MVKDKLVKFNHKAAFYRMRKCAILSACFLFGAVAIALPLSLTLNNQDNSNVRAEEESSEVVSSSEASEDELITTY